MKPVAPFEWQLPPTRAKSPKLGRRKSFSDAVGLSQEDKGIGARGRVTRHSFGYYKDGTTANSKDQISLQNGMVPSN